MNTNLFTDVEFRKRQLLSEVMFEQLNRIKFIDYDAKRFICNLLHYLRQPNNYYDLHTILSWFDIFLLDEDIHTQKIITDFIERCLYLYEQEGGAAKVIKDIENELNQSGKSDQETIEMTAKKE